MTCSAPARATARGAAHAAGPGAFGDRFPTQPIAVGRIPERGVLHDRRPHAPARPPARSPRLTVIIAVAVVIAAMTGALGYRTWAVSSLPAAATRPATPAPQADDVQRPPSPPRRGDDRRGGLGEADGAVPDGTTVFDDGIPGVANLDPDLLDALRRAATDAADEGVEFTVNSGWRSAEYQDQLLREAVAEHGSEEAAARWVATPDTSPHVSGDAIDVGPSAATAWLSEHGAEYGLCQVYRNEPWHYELRPEAADDGCPAPYADPTHDPRMQR